MPLLEPTDWLVPEVADDPTASETERVEPVETDSVTPRAMDWLVPSVSVIPLVTPFETPLVTPAVFVAETESLTPEVEPDARDKLWPTPLESESEVPRAAAVLEDVPKESVRVLLLETEAPAVVVVELVPPSE